MEAFRAAHRSAGEDKPLYLGHQHSEGIEMLSTVAPITAFVTG